MAKERLWKRGRFFICIPLRRGVKIWTCATLYSSALDCTYHRTHPRVCCVVVIGPSNNFKFARVGELANPPGLGPGFWRFDPSRGHQVLAQEGKVEEPSDCNPDVSRFDDGPVLQSLLQVYGRVRCYGRQAVLKTVGWWTTHQRGSNPHFSANLFGEAGIAEPSRLLIDARWKQRVRVEFPLSPPSFTASWSSGNDCGL